MTATPPPRRTTHRTVPNINERIRFPKVRLIDADGTQLGIMSPREALSLAQERELDLVVISEKADPPVCRIMDYGKFKYQQRKRQHKTHSRQTKIKEIWVRPGTGEHDLQVKLNRAREFLTEKNKVVVAVRFRGRELAHIEEGRKVLDNILARLEDLAKVETPPSHQGRRIVCTLAPK